MVAELLAAGADPLATNAKKQRPREIAAYFGYTAAEAMLAAAEAKATVVRDRQKATEAATRGEERCVAAVGDGGVGAARRYTPRVCPECGEAVKLGRLRKIRARVEAGVEENAHVLEFASSAALKALGADATFHRSLDNRKLRKEVSETWARRTCRSRGCARAAFPRAAFPHRTPPSPTAPPLRLPEVGPRRELRRAPRRPP